MIKKALLVIGSTKEKSTSASLGNTLLAGLAASGISTAALHINEILARPRGLDKAVEEISASDLLILSFPVRADSPPAPLIQLLETLGKRRKNLAASDRIALAVISNSGFPSFSELL